MSLKDALLHIPSLKVPFKGGSFEVRGLSLSDVTVIVSIHREKLNEILGAYTASGGNLTTLDAEESLPFLIDVVQLAPAVVAHIIAQAEVRPDGEPPQIAGALRLPVDVQIDAIEKVLKLTFETEGGLGKVMETVIRAFTGLTRFAISPKA